MTNHSYADCRSREGICVGLIDSLITISRVLTKELDPGTEAIVNALAALGADKYFVIVRKLAQSAQIELLRREKTRNLGPVTSGAAARQTGL